MCSLRLISTFVNAVGSLNIGCLMFVGCYTLFVLGRSNMSPLLLPSPVELKPVKRSICVNSNDYWCSDFFNGVEEVLVVPPHLGDNSFFLQRLYTGSKRTLFIKVT